jgi:hypothetical protein
MPWKVRKSGNKYQVVNSETGDVKGTHDTEEGAKKQVAALYSNVPESRKDNGHMDIQTKSVEATISDVESSSDTGEFEVVLATSDLDRDGDTLKGDEWELPLPNRIQFNTDHDHKVASTVGSAVPQLDGDKIICRGSWASTQHAQETRQLVKEGHITTVSVAYREKRNHKSAKPSRELINGSFVVVPANPKAVVLSSKSAKDYGETLTRAIELLGEAKTLVEQLTTKDGARENEAPQELPAPEAPEESADLSADQREKGLTPELRARVLALQTRHETD